jgi:hypothetical protein
MPSSLHLRRRGLVDALTCAAFVAIAGCGASEQSADSARVTPVYDPASGRLRQLLFDRNGNGVVDTRLYMNGTLADRAELDQDEDGRTERWEYYGKSGEIGRVAMSIRRDGKPDTWVHRAADGRVARVELAGRGDGRVSRIEFYENGSLLRIEEDSDGDGRVDKWERYTDGELASVSFAPAGGSGPPLAIDYGADGSAGTPSNGTESGDHP